MPGARLVFAALSLLMAAGPALAAPPTSATAEPLESPATWIDPGNYPAIARRFGITGTTEFRLAVDASGQPTRCDITQSSGFDVLDTATCQRLMARARFAPPRDATGKPVAGSYANRVKWLLDGDSRPPISELYGSLLVATDQTGKIASCRFVVHIPAEVTTLAENPCEQAQNSQISPLGAEFAGTFHGPSAEFELRSATVFTPALRAQVLAPVPGHAQRGLNIQRFTVSRDGKLLDCSYEEQRGSERLMQDFCAPIRGASFDPPFAAFDANGVATGWVISRLLLKTGE